MSDYIVSARKYRPQTFDTVVGQEHITTTLKNAIKNQHLAHAYLFCGPRGVGKTTCARILAKTINCETPTPDMEACGVCPTCTSFKNNTSFNVFELDAASNNSVDDIRELTNQVRFTPQQGKYKVYVIDEVHMLSSAAFNAFLKTLEEPPHYAIFILATTEKHKILPTILSRCQIFDFKRITTNDIVGHLQGISTKEGMVADEAALHVIAQKSEGCMRDALSMLDRIASFTNGMLTYNGTMEHLNLLDADYYFGITDTILAQDVAGTLLLLDKAMEKGFEGDTIIGGLAEHLRNLLLCKDVRMAKLLDVPAAHKPVFYEKANQTPPSFIVSALNVITQCELEYKNATNKRLHVEMCLIRLCYVLHAVSGIQAANAADVKKNSGQVAEPSTPTPNYSYLSAPQQAISQPPTVPEPSTTYHTPQPPAPVVNEMPSAPVPTQSAAPQSAAAPRPVASAARPVSGGARKLSRGLLDDIESDDILLKNQPTVELSYDLAVNLFNEYKQMLRDEGKGMIFSQLDMMKLEVNPPDEIRLISPTTITDNYAQSQRSALLDFYREKTKLLIRITTEAIIDESIVNAQKVTVLSKSEIFEAMATKNPSLYKLRDMLNLQLEY